jgi:hypothetical protein
VSARSFLNTKDIILFVPSDRGSYFSKGCVEGPIDSFCDFIGTWFFVLVRGDFLSFSHHSNSRPIRFIIRSLWYSYLGLGIISFSHSAGGSDCHLGFRFFPLFGSSNVLSSFWNFFILLVSFDGVLTFCVKVSFLPIIPAGDFGLISFDCSNDH